ncbi:MAG: T9SS type A sorting domain-containing protein [candidate division Zixibacteria bacterium]|nr:T9SS type A sorting domain-containing protein [candidate division Zixibacteria bacterium]
MKKYLNITILTFFVLLLCIGYANGKNYAVLISAGEATADNEEENSEFWYDLFLIYTTLIDEGYNHDDIYVLYGYGYDFDQTTNPNYQNPYPENITDFPCYLSNIEYIFGLLGSIITEDDFLFVWWMGHGGKKLRVLPPIGWHLKLKLDHTNEHIWDFQLANHINQIQDYRKRTFAFMTCHDGGIIDDLEGPNTLVLTSAPFDYESFSDWLCDSWHAEFNYYVTCALHSQSPFDLCEEVDTDYDEDDWISFNEAFNYTHSNMIFSEPQISDQGGNAPNRFLGFAMSCCPDGNSDFLTIQNAIDAAHNGYNILLCNNTFASSGNRNISYNGKAITVKSRFGNPSLCIVDCQETARGFYFHTGEDSNSVLDGITIRNGYAHLAWGGGICCYESSPKITNCIIKNNNAYYGAISCQNCSPLITDCKITENSTDWGGGGIKCSGSSPVVTRSEISENSSGSKGGGIECSAGSNLTLTNCTINNNNAEDGGGGFSIFDSDLIINNSTVSDNHANENGGGVYLSNSASITFENTILWHNSANGTGDEGYVSSSSVVSFECSDVDSSEIKGSGNALWGDYTIFEDPEFCRDSLPDFPYTLCDISPCAPNNSPGDCNLIGAWPVGCECLPDTCLDCSVANYSPRVPREGGTIYWDMTVTNCGSVSIPSVYGEILPTNTDCNGSQYDFNLYKVIGTGFAPGASFTDYYYYRPAPGTVPYPTFTEVALWTYVGTAPNNYLSACCFEFTFTTEWGRGGDGDSWGGNGEWGERDGETALPTITALNQNYPNPFNATTNISFDLAQAGDVNLSVYNLQGQKVESLISDRMSAGNYTIRWDASMYSSGIYYYKLTTEEKTFTKRMTLLK